MAFFKTSRVESNEVVKAEDISYNFNSQVSNFSVLLQGLVDNKHDFVVGGKVSVLSGMNLSIEPILGCCKETGICFVSTEKITEGIAVSTGESQDRIDIVQIKAIEEDYDEQQRSFIDFETKIETVQNVFTKKRVILQVEVKKGVAGSVVAPSTDTGFVKLAEIYVPANTLTIDEWGIYNITANYNGEDNTDWTNEKDRTYDFQYLSDLNKEFQSEHNKDGTHKKGVIGSDELDYGVGEKQINNAILPIGKNIAIDNTNYFATTQTSSFLEILASKISTIFADYYNKGGKYNFNGELKISDLFSNNALTKPLRIKSDGKGFAYFYIGNKLIFTITESGLFQMPSGYNATATNEVVTKATTDAIIGQLSTINTKIGEIETLINSNQEFVNSVFNRYTFSDKVITVATTANISLSGKQTIDGIALDAGNVVLVKNQTTTKQNGIYEVQTGAWNRLSGFTEFSSIKNKFFTITKGTANEGKVFFSPQEVCTLGTDNLIFKESFYKNLETKYTVPIRDSNGNIKTGTPSATNDAATKSYVDDAGTKAKNLENATGVLSLEHGGTGATTQNHINYNMANSMTETVTAPNDGSLIAMRVVTPAKTESNFYYRKASLFWDYIKGKISSVLGLTASNYSGTSTKATSDENGVNIADNYARKISTYQKPYKYENDKPTYHWYKILDGATLIDVSGRQVKVKVYNLSDTNYPYRAEFTVDVTSYVTSSMQTISVNLINHYMTHKDDGNLCVAVDSDFNVYFQNKCLWESSFSIETKLAVGITPTQTKLGHSAWVTDPSDFVSVKKITDNGMFRMAKNISTGAITFSQEGDSIAKITATKATADKNGNDIVDTYATKDVATTTENGLMSSTDKSKLAGLSNYTHPTDSGNKHIPSGGSSGQILRWSADGTAVWGADYTLPAATTSTLGGVKVKKTTSVETSSSSRSITITSTNVNKIIEVPIRSGQQVSVYNNSGVPLKVFITGYDSSTSYYVDSAGIVPNGKTLKSDSLQSANESCYVYAETLNVIL